MKTKKSNSKKHETFTIVIDPELKHKLYIVSASKNISRSKYVMNLIEKDISRYEKQNKNSLKKLLTKN